MQSVFSLWRTIRNEGLSCRSQERHWACWTPSASEWTSDKGEMPRSPISSRIVLLCSFASSDMFVVNKIDRREQSVVESVSRKKLE